MKNEREKKEHLSFYHTEESFVAPVVPKKRVPAIVARMDERIQREATPRTARKLRAAAKLLLGLRFRREEGSLLMPEERWMEYSDTYLEILEKGEVKGRVSEARKFLLRPGETIVVFQNNVATAEIRPPSTPIKANCRAQTGAVESRPCFRAVFHPDPLVGATGLFVAALASKSWGAFRHAPSTSSSISISICTLLLPFRAWPVLYNIRRGSEDVPI